MSRPNTLSQAADHIRAGVSRSVAIPEFLDTFYLASCKEERAAMLLDEPAPSGSARLDALMAAICEYLSKQHDLPSVPAWTSGPSRFLEDPWFTSTIQSDGMREYLAFSSPAEFRNHGIFTEARPLRRASQRFRDAEGDAPGPRAA